MMRIAGVVAFLLMCAGGAVGAQERAGEAILRPGDILRIAVWPEPALAGEFAIESSGTIYLPMVGAVRVGGRALDAVRTELRERYSALIQNAVVTATPLFRVSVIGAVQRPDLYQVDPTHTVFDLISRAGGFTPGAELEQLRLIRGDSIIVLDGKRALENGESALSVALHSGDRLVVPERPDRGRKWQPILAVLQATALVATLAIQIF